MFGRFPIYRKISNNSDTKTFTVIILKFEQSGFTIQMQKDTDRMANSADADQTALLGAVGSRSTLFAQTCLSKNLVIQCNFFFSDASILQSIQP